MPDFKHKAWLIVLALLGLVYCLVEAEGEGDFYIFISAGGNLTAHKNIFETLYQYYYNYFYSVLFALCLAPFYTLPFYGVKVCWLLLNLLLYCHLFRLLAKSAPVKQLPAKRQRLFLLLVFLVSLRFVHENLHYSQVTILILWSCVYGIYLIQRNKAIAGSAVLALGINIKLLPLVFLPYLVYRGYFKAFAFTVLFYGLSLFVPALFIGYEYNMSMLHSWLKLINPAQKRHVLDVEERSFHGLSTLLSTLLVKNVPDTYALPIKRNIADLSLPALARILLLTRLALAGFTLYFLKGLLFRHSKPDFSTCIEVSYILLLIPLIFPHQQHYAFLFCVPAFAAILYGLLLHYERISRLHKQLVIGTLTLVYLCTNLKLLLGEYNPYYEHFKLLTYGALLLIPLLVWVTRQQRKAGLLVAQQ